MRTSIMTNANNDQSISDDDWLIRRIHDKHVVPDKNLNCWRISSAAFNPSSSDSGVSVHIEKMIKQAGLSPKDYVKSKGATAAAKIKAEFIRSLNMDVESSPVNDDPYHGNIWGITEGGNKKESDKKKMLARMAVWLLKPPMEKRPLCE